MYGNKENVKFLFHMNAIPFHANTHSSKVLKSSYPCHFSSLRLRIDHWLKAVPVTNITHCDMYPFTPINKQLFMVLFILQVSSHYSSITHGQQENKVNTTTKISFTQKSSTTKIFIGLLKVCNNFQMSLHLLKKYLCVSCPQNPKNGPNVSFSANV